MARKPNTTGRRLQARWICEDATAPADPLEDALVALLAKPKSPQPYRYRVHVACEVRVACGAVIAARGDTVEDVAQDFVNHAYHWLIAEDFRGYGIETVTDRDNATPPDFATRFYAAVKQATARGPQDWPVIQDSDEDRIGDEFMRILQEEITREIDREILAALRA